MEEFLPLLFIIIFWSLIGSSARKLKQSGKGRKQTVRQKKPDSIEADSTNTGKKSAGSAAPSSTTASPVSHGHSDPYQGSLGISFMEGVDPCHDDPYLIPEGSLQVDIPEGTDPCHPGSAAASAASGQTAAGPASSGLNLRVTGNEVVQGFIWGEILNRKRA